MTATTRLDDSRSGASRQLAPPDAPIGTDRAVAFVAEALGRLRFGEIRLIVHDGRLVQIDLTERTRFTQS